MMKNIYTTILNQKFTLHLIFTLIGFTAVISQIIFLREFIVIFHGNEISLGIFLANWLFWTACGSFLFGRIIRNIKTPVSMLPVLQLIVALAIPVTIILIRFSKQVLQDTPGEILGIFSIFLDSFVVLSVFCLFSGGLFATGAFIFAHRKNENLMHSSGIVYLFESIGSGIGGVLVSLLLIPNFSSIQISVFISLANIFVASYFILTIKKSLSRILTLLFFIALLFFVSGFNSISYNALWNYFPIIANKNSLYGNLTILDVEGNKILYENGLVLFTIPDQEKAEEVVHFSLLQHSYPRSIMLISGGVSGIIREILKYPSVERIDYVELDPVILDLAKKYFYDNWKEMEQNSKVSIFHRDARRFLKQTDHKYDVIIINLPDPHTAQLNRFYTREFFQIAAERLHKNGILTFQLSAAENYISEGLAQFLRCIHNTLLDVFNQVAYIPGNTIHFFATNQSKTFNIDPDSLIVNLNTRNIKTEYIREYYIPFRLMPDRIHTLSNMIKPLQDTKINSDFSPIAYYYDLIIWTSQFLPKYNKLFEKFSGLKFYQITACIIILFLLLFILFFFIIDKARYIIYCSGFAVISLGFTSIALEILLLLSFQAVFGYVYHQLAIIIGFFMTGMAFASWIAIKKSKKSNLRFLLKNLIIIHLAVALIPIGLTVIIKMLSDTSELTLDVFISYIIFPAMAFICGGVGGYQFPIVSGIYFDRTKTGFQNTGIIYGLDLIGAVFGALLISIILIPLFGFFHTALLMSILNVLVIVFIVSGIYLKK